MTPGTLYTGYPEIPLRTAKKRLMLVGNCGRIKPYQRVNIRTAKREPFMTYSLQRQSVQVTVAALVQILKKKITVAALVKSLSYPHPESFMYSW